jgi:hypothetical protein
MGLCSTLLNYFAYMENLYKAQSFSQATMASFCNTPGFQTVVGRFRKGMCISSQNWEKFRAYSHKNLRGIKFLSR